MRASLLNLCMVGKRAHCLGAESNFSTGFHLPQYPARMIAQFTLTYRFHRDFLFDRAGLVYLNRNFGLISGTSAWFMPPRSAVAS